MTRSHLTFPIRSDKLSMTASVKREIASHRSEFQNIEVIETEVFGRVLLLDGHIQLAEFDEAAYHESLVHVPLLSIGTPKRALVIGGGDGGVLRELVKHKDLEHIDMVEIDKAVVDVCREHLPAVSNGAFDDPRVQLHIADAFPFVKEVSDPYDLIIMDVTDVYEDEEGELSEQLFTQTFHEDCRRALSPQGVLVSQADNHVFCPYSLDAVLGDLGKVFPRTGWYQALIPSFGGYSAYAWASNMTEIRKDFPGAEFQLRYLNDVTWCLLETRLPFG
ncbi:MAG TPA: polyamine aminopropyltransferase [Fimbriimonadaceae bacterium]|nr:polyamine aminopropyltransferase [Fimbriimonadaceae bacterium]